MHMHKTQNYAYENLKKFTLMLWNILPQMVYNMKVCVPNFCVKTIEHS